MKTKLILLAMLLWCGSAVTASKNDNFYANPLLLNGRPLDLKTFSAASRGVLTFVKGDPYACNMPKVPFVIYLKRGDQIINEGVSSSSYERTQVEIGPIMDIARFGDELIILPTRASDQHAKQVIQLTKFLPDLFQVFKKDGC
ncbi:MAG: hypothetical protein MUE30_03535 [Spirosomaceae bacterium]|jgi:hypothetical protein|nr:hypothetical protein [Spirosomataceae bacterium]